MARLLAIVCIVFIFSAWQAEEVNDAQLSIGDVRILNQLDDISYKIDTFEENLFAILSKDLYTKYLARTDKFYSTIEYIDGEYKKFMNLTKNDTPEELQGYYRQNALGGSKNDLPNQVKEIHNLLIKPDGLHQTFFGFLAYEAGYEIMCYRRQSLQQVILQFYNEAVLADLKGLAVILVNLHSLNETNIEKIESSSQHELKSFNQRCGDKYKAVVKYIASASREVWRCDPPSFIKEKSYSKLQEIFQAMITNEKDVASFDQQCSKTYCNEYNEYNFAARSTFFKIQSEKLRCNGQIVQCQDTDSTIKFCRARPEDDRRYEGMMTSISYGDYSPECEDHIEDHEVNRSWGVKCKFCLCTCATMMLEVDRYFSLRPSISNIDDGMVVTGVRLMKINNVFHIKIQQGHLGQNGTIDDKSEHWKEIDDEKLDFTKIYRKNPKDFWVTTKVKNFLEGRQAHFIMKPPNFKDFLKNEDVFNVHWGQKTVLLNDILSESSETDKVLTGLKFTQEGDALMLNIRLTPIDYQSGKVLGVGEWVHRGPTTKKGRKRISLLKADDPLRKKRHVPDQSGENKYLEFQITNLKKNMGQFTVPFLDIQDVVTYPPTPMVGAGLYHKGIANGESGGFLGLKLIQYDFSKHL